jgi:hypothetical protein
MTRIFCVLSLALAACATQPPTPAPRDLLRLADEFGTMMTLQSSVVGCQAPWRRAVSVNRKEGSTPMWGCWMFDREGNLVVDWEDGQRTTIKASAFKRRELGV